MLMVSFEICSGVHGKGPARGAEREWLLGRSLSPLLARDGVRAIAPNRLDGRITLPAEDAFARGHLPRTGTSGVPAKGVALGDWSGDPRARRHPGARRRSDLAGCGRGGGDGGDLPLRRVGDPRLPAPREADQGPGPQGRDHGGPGASRPPPGAERPRHGPPLLVAGSVPDAAGGAVHCRRRSAARHADRGAGAARRPDHARESPASA